MAGCQFGILRSHIVVFCVAVMYFFCVAVYLFLYGRMPLWYFAEPYCVFLRSRVFVLDGRMLLRHFPEPIMKAWACSPFWWPFNAHSAYLRTPHIRTLCIFTHILQICAYSRTLHICNSYVRRCVLPSFAQPNSKEPPPPPTTIHKTLL